MDANGARQLAARLQAGVRVGDEVEVVSGVPADADLHAGDRGVVQEITVEGRILVAWERGFDLAVDPWLTSLRVAA
jgi:hypothetical protein